MKVQTLTNRSVSEEPPRSTAYYYADLERLKRKEPITEAENHVTSPPLVENVTTNDVINDGPIREVPPFRDRQWSLPEYTTPENSRKEETYSTAGTFPMPEPREKEPLLAELEIVGRLPLTQLDSTGGVRRSRSWYLCCPNVPDEEISRESSWRYSSLRPVTAPPVPGQNGLHALVATQSSGHTYDLPTLRAERDALSRALSAERARSAAAARAHDARLAELHGVIAELVRRRDKTAAIPEEEASDECESTTQPAGELDNDADRSRTEQNDTSSVSPELTPAERSDHHDLPEDTTDTSTQEPNRDQPQVTITTPPPEAACDASLQLSERDSELCLSTARCCQYVRQSHSGSGAGSCEREHGSADGRGHTTGRAASRQAKVASRVRLRKTEDSEPNLHTNNDEAWCADAAERLALDVCAQADLREALVTANNDGEALSASIAAWKARCARLEADKRVLECALLRATDTAHKLSCACAAAESSCVCVCSALRAADRALETYDVLLALQETQGAASEQREAAELVAKQLLSRLDAEHVPALGEPLLSPGPWLTHDPLSVVSSPWSPQQEARLRAHAARLKADTVALRNLTPPPHFMSYHDIVEEGDLPQYLAGDPSYIEMEQAVDMQEMLAEREAYLTARAATLLTPRRQHNNEESRDEFPPRDSDSLPQVHETGKDIKTESTRRRRRERHWLDAAETNL